MKNVIKFLCMPILIGVFLCSSLISPSVFAEKQNTLIVFSGRKEPLIKPVIDLFEKETGITVTLKTGDSTALGQQIIQEMPEPSADIFIAKESGSLEYLKTQGVFVPYQSDATAKIPDRFKDRDGAWIGASGRSRAVIYNKSLVDEAAVPRTLAELSDPKWKGKIAAVTMGNESLVAWVSALNLYLGNERTEDILTKLKNNDIQLISKSHTDIRKAVGRGEYPLGLINHYYYHLQKHEMDKAYTNVGIVYLDQADGQRGELVNVSGAAIVKNAKNTEAAQKFIDFIVSPLAQKLFAEVNFEYPLLPSVQTHPEVLAAINCEVPSVIKCLNVMNVNLDQLGSKWTNTLKLLEKINWN